MPPPDHPPHWQSDIVMIGPRLVAGVDSSTQSCKVVIRDADSGRVIRHGRARHPNGTEVEPDAWWAALLDAIDAAGGLDDVAAISVAGQQHGMVALDKAGRVVRPALLWNDTRSAAEAEEMIRKFGRDELVRRTGSAPVPSFTATKLRWLRKHEPESAARVAAVALPHDWLTWRLRGYGPDRPELEALTTDRSDASGTSYWSPTEERYDRDIFTWALGHDAALPTVLSGFAAAGETAGTGVRPGVVIAAGAGDNAAAALGLRANQGDVIASIGTSGTVFAQTDSMAHDLSGVVAGFADATGGFLPLVATLNAARVLDVVASLLGVDHAGLGELALGSRAGAAGLVLQPYFEGERTPNLPNATATLFGMTLGSTTRENLARAAIEGMLCSLAECVEMLRGVGIRERRVVLIGGAAQNAAVSTIAAEIFGAPVFVPEPDEYVAAGAATQAAWALRGTLPSWEISGRLVTSAGDRAPVLSRYRSMPRPI